MPSASVAIVTRANPAASAQHAQRVAGVPRDALEHRLPSGITDAILHGLDAAHFRVRNPDGVGAAHPGGNLLLDGCIQILAELLVEVRFHARLRDECRHAGNDAPEKCLQSSPGEALRIRAMADVCASQSRASRLSCVRPSGVSE